MAPLYARGIIFLGDVLRRRQGRSRQKRYDSKRVASFETAVRGIPNTLIVMNAGRRTDQDLNALKKALSPDLAFMVVDRVTVSGAGRYAKHDRIVRWLRERESERLDWVAIESTRNGYRPSSNLLLVHPTTGFDSVAGAGLADKLIWGPSFERTYLNDFLDPQAWLTAAAQLLKSIRLFEPQVTTAIATAKSWKGPPSPTNPFPDLDACRTYLLLGGYALENLLKAALIQRYRPKYKDSYAEKKTLPEELKKHDLYSLGVRAGLRLTLSDETFLRRLTQAVEWYSRYPVPSKPEGFMVMFSDRKTYNLRSINGDDPERFEAFVARILAEFGFHQRGLEPATQSRSVAEPKTVR